MVKAFTQSNRDLIRKTLLKKGREYFIRYGLKKTSVDELTRAAGISKGSFYKFFDSKEALFLAIHEESEEKLRTDLIRKLAEISKPIDKLHTLFESSFLILEEDPLLRAILNKEEFGNLAIFLSSDQYELHYRYDIGFLGELIKQWQTEGIIRQLDAEVAGNMIASIYHVILQKETLGEVMYKKVTQMLIECLSNYFVESQ